MVTRIRYKKVYEDHYEGPEFHALGNILQPYYVYSDEGFLGGVYNLTIRDTYEIITPQPLTKLKRQLKRELIARGVKFDSEVRRKRTQKQAIEHALKEKE